jgi:hypothetical protein
MVTVALLHLALVAGADLDQKAETRKHAFDLVEQLADPSFRVRERVSAELVHLGGPAVDALRKGLNHQDAEVCERCRKLLPRALDVHFQEEIELFLAKPDAPPPADLPGLKRWFEIAGTTKESRHLFARLIKEQRRTLIDVAQDPDGATQVFQRFCQDVFNRTRGQVAANPTKENGASESEVLLFFVLSCDPKCRNAVGRKGVIPYAQVLAFVRSTHVAGMLSGPTASEPSKKLFLGWLEQERYLASMRQGYILAANAGLKEAVPIAFRAAADKAITPAARTYPLIAVANLLGPEHLKELEPLLTNNTVIGRTNVGGNLHTTEMRDIALGLAVKATGQKTADYGFRLRETTMATNYLQFAMSDESREAAFKKWAEWMAKQKK